MKFFGHLYQDRAEQFIIDNPSAALFLDMGLGKTVAVLNAFNTLKYEMGVVQSMLVVAPLRVALLTWRQEAKKWDHLKHLKVTLLHGNNKQKLMHRKSDIYIINYDGLRWMRDVLSTKGGKFPQSVDLIVFDESTQVKTPSSQRSKIAQALSLGVERRIILTGSPTPNGILDLWHQIYLLDFGKRLGSGYTDFRAQNFIANDTGMKYFPMRGVTDRVTQDIGDISLTMKAEDYLDMPDKILNDVKVCLPEKLKKRYDEFERDFFITLGDSDVIAFNASALSMKLRQFVQGFVYDTEKGIVHDVHSKKIEALREIVDGAGGPVLVAIQFRHEAGLIKKEFGEDTPIIYGGTKTEDTIRYVEAWNRGELPILVAHPASMSHGVNLQEGGNTIAWLGIPWNLEHYIQFNARLYRQGQQRSVIIHHVLMKDTIDEVVLRVLQSKEGSMNSLIEALKNWREER